MTVVGAGGHAKVVISTARADGYNVTRVVDDDPAHWGQDHHGVIVSGPVAPVLADPAARVVLAIGDNRTRLRLAESARCTFVRIIHPAALVDGTVAVGGGTVVFAGAIVQPDTILGDHVIVNTGASIDHDCVLEAGVHVAPGARLAGNVTLGEAVLIGIGAVVIPGVTIGDGTTVGAGAAVVGDLPAGVVARGVPARAFPREPGG